MFSQSKERRTKLSRDTTRTIAVKLRPEKRYEMYVRPFHRELALVGMRQFWRRSFLPRPVNGLPHGHIQSEVHDRLAPAMTEKPVHIYSNRKAVAAAACDDKLKMYAWDNKLKMYAWDKE